MAGAALACLMLQPKKPVVFRHCLTVLVHMSMDTDTTLRMVGEGIPDRLMDAMRTELASASQEALDTGDGDTTMGVYLTFLSNVAMDVGGWAGCPDLVEAFHSKAFALVLSEMDQWGAGKVRSCTGVMHLLVNLSAFPGKCALRMVTGETSRRTQRIMLTILERGEDIATFRYACMFFLNAVRNDSFSREAVVRLCVHDALRNRVHTLLCNGGVPPDATAAAVAEGEGVVRTPAPPFVLDDATADALGTAAKLVAMLVCRADNLETLFFEGGWMGVLLRMCAAAPRCVLLQRYAMLAMQRVVARSVRVLELVERAVRVPAAVLPKQEDVVHPLDCVKDMAATAFLVLANHGKDRDVAINALWVGAVCGLVSQTRCSQRGAAAIFNALTHHGTNPKAISSMLAPFLLICEEVACHPGGDYAGTMAALIRVFPVCSEHPNGPWPMDAVCARLCQRLKDTAPAAMASSLAPFVSNIGEQLMLTAL